MIEVICEDGAFKAKGSFSRGIFDGEMITIFT